MTLKDEIEDLKKALDASPDNTFLLLMLIRKMEQAATYDDELDHYLHKAIKLDGRNKELKGLLMKLYFRQGKYSACLVIAEESGDVYEMPKDLKILVAKAYLKLGDNELAKDIYKSMVEEEADFSDEELDKAFRLKVSPKEEEIDENDKLFAKPDISFSDVGGMENVKREIDLKIIKPLENAALFASYGKKLEEGFCFMVLQDVVRPLLPKPQPDR